ncbi:hypothetical protein V1264_003410 [Littorina saxatilis]|uniref:Sushi, von Willebrand factor type A, EGF and pentraxin domain-containing protein 1-like n=1 Tax=Littorina saxatilis TaxID=31220 RepID=A0AAN9B5D5_9CAEN
MKGIITVLLLILCAVVVLGCGSSRRPPPPPPPPKYQPDFAGCPGDVTKLPDPGTLATVVSWTEPTARSRNDGNRKVVVTRVGGPSPGSTFQAGSPVKITYQAMEGNGVPPSYCSFYVTVEARYCDPLPTLNHGRRTCSGSRDNIYGSVCTHACSAGYKVNGPDTVTCKDTKQWDKRAPLCEPVSCGAPGNIDHGSTVCFRGHTYSEMCSTACNSGYMHTGSPFITCGANGVWSNADPCVDKEPPTFPNGCPGNQVLYTGPLERPVAVFWTDPDTNDNSGQSVTLTSNPARGSLLGPGFYLFKLIATDMASNEASCMFVVDIKSRECDAITAPANSRVTCSRGYVEGSECMVTCNRGYDIQGQALLTCLQSEQWNVALPTCDAGGCSTPPTVENGVLKCSSGQTYLATCDLVCDAGFEVQTPPYIQCTYNGTWTTPGSCADTEPPDFPQDCPDNIEIYAASLGQPNLVTWAPPDVTDNSGKAVELVSDIQPGSNFSVGVTRVKYKATDVNGNSKKCFFTVTVNTAVCPVPALQPQTTQGVRMLYDCPDGHVYGASCALNCTHGYPLVGSDTITCQRDDSTFPPTMTWYWAGSAVPPECTNIQCPELKAPKNGALSCNQGNFGVDCLMSCNVRYDVPAALPLDGHIYCNSAGWHPSSVPDCTVLVRPGGARFHSDLAYYTGSCKASLDELKQNFITRMQNSTILRDACTNVPTCTVDNVKVTCGSVSAGRRKRETLQDFGGAPERNKRDASQSHFVRIDFDIAIPYQPNATQSFDDYAQALNSTNAALKSSLQDGQGAFDIEGMTNAGFSPPTLQADCPAGTTYRVKTPLSCVGCSKGLYMPDQSGQCFECAVGSYTELDNATSCTPCPQGMSTLSTGSQSQDDCNYVQRAVTLPTALCPVFPVLLVNTSHVTGQRPVTFALSTGGRRILGRQAFNNVNLRT